ncbi:MAG: hypothetical protein ACJAT6_001795 [Akkermansiaceae bacterium]
MATWHSFCREKSNENTTAQALLEANDSEKSLNPDSPKFEQRSKELNNSSSQKEGPRILLEVTNDESVAPTRTTKLLDQRKLMNKPPKNGSRRSISSTVCKAALEKASALRYVPRT